MAGGVKNADSSGKTRFKAVKRGPFQRSLVRIARVRARLSSFSSNPGAKVTEKDHFSRELAGVCLPVRGNGTDRSARSERDRRHEAGRSRSRRRRSRAACGRSSSTRRGSLADSRRLPAGYAKAARFDANSQGSASVPGRSTRPEVAQVRKPRYEANRVDGELGRRVEVNDTVRGPAGQFAHTRKIRPKLIADGDGKMARRERQGLRGRTMAFEPRVTLSVSI